MGETNPIQWSKFEHVGQWYAEHCKDRIKTLSVPATIIQRRWHQYRGQGIRDVGPMIECFQFVKDRLGANDNVLTQNFRAYEKLDGTNFGIRCDGAKFGRRFRVNDNAYQKVPLEGIIPTGSTVAKIKAAMLGPNFKDSGIELVLYGELMCNPRKFDYMERDMNHRFYCFGAMLAFPSDFTDEYASSVREELTGNGFALKTHDSFGRAVPPREMSRRVVLNDKLRTLLAVHDVECVPLMGEGPLGDLCFRMKATLMKDDMEGVVLTGDQGSLFKWKTSIEDGSGTESILRSLLVDHSSTVLKLAGVDVMFVLCLIEVAKKKPQYEKKTKATKSKKITPQTAPYDDATLENALASAMTKYDSLEAYFARGERAAIKSLLRKEVCEDLGASAPNQVKCVNNAAGKKVGEAFGRWKMERDLQDGANPASML